MQGGVRDRLVVVGNGMVGHRFLEFLGERVAATGRAPFDVTVLGEEPRLAYDRVGLSAFFDGKTPEDLALVRPGQYEAAGFTVRLSTRGRRIDRARRVVEVDGGEIPYDHLVLATGSSAFVPPVPGRDLPGCFVYRTIEDLEAISAWAADHPGGTGAVIGGGLLGLEAAYALQKLGMKTHVVELAPRLMALQLDDAGGAVLRKRIEEIGVVVHTATASREVVGADGRVRALRFADGTELDVDAVVFSAGIRPRDELARAAGAAGRRARRHRRSISARAPPTPRSTRSANARRTRAAATAWSRPATRWRGRRSPISAAATTSSRAST